MIGYNPSHLNKNETLLEAFHRVEAYLKANPQYQVYQSSATYQVGTLEYALDTIIVPEGSKVSSGDVVLFSNVYYAVITAVSETTFSIGTATNFRGAQGEQGPKGDTGATGAKGETGLAALMYSKNVTLGPYQSFSTDLDGYNRTPQIHDMCLYTSSNTDLVINGTIEEIRPDTQQVMVRKISILSTQGPRGEQGPKGENGKDGNATLLYAGELSESITTVETAQITSPKNRGVLVKDILISTATSTFGAMAQVTAKPVGVTTVDVSFIGTLESGGGGTTLNNYTYSINLKNLSVSQLERLLKILTYAKGRVTIGNPLFTYNVFIPNKIRYTDDVYSLTLCNDEMNDGTAETLKHIYKLYAGNISDTSKIVPVTEYLYTFKSDGTFVFTSKTSNTDAINIGVVYFNDTEIT